MFFGKLFFRKIILFFQIRQLNFLISHMINHFRGIKFVKVQKTNSRKFFYTNKHSISFAHRTFIWDRIYSQLFFEKKSNFTSLVEIFTYVSICKGNFRIWNIIKSREIFSFSVCTSGEIWLGASTSWRPILWFFCNFSEKISSQNPSTSGQRTVRAFAETIFLPQTDLTTLARTRQAL